MITSHSHSINKLLQAIISRSLVLNLTVDDFQGARQFMFYVSEERSKKQIIKRDLINSYLDIVSSEETSYNY